MAIKPIKAIEDFGIDALRVSLGLLAVILFFVVTAMPELFSATMDVLIRAAPVWLPIMLAYTTWRLFVYYNRSRFLAKTDHVLLEIKIPREITRSPRAMELFFDSIYNTGQEATFIDRYFNGQMRMYMSFEIISDGGKVRFFMYVRAALKDHIEAKLYAHYPELQILEVPDYTREHTLDLDTMSLFGTEFKYAKSTAYPLKTYVDYELDKDPKEEFKIDPLVTIIETLGRFEPGQQFWVQFVMRGRKKDDKHGLFGLRKKDGFPDLVKEEIQKIFVDSDALTDTGRPDYKKLSKGEQIRIESMQRKAAKSLYNVGIRVIYFGKNENFKGNYIPNLINLFRPYGGGNLNSLSVNGYSVKYDYPWQDFKDIRKDSDKRKLFRYYRRRAFFQPIYWPKTNIMSSEELASLFHPVGDVAQTPTLDKIQSRRSGAPSNLPT